MHHDADGTRNQTPSLQQMAGAVSMKYNAPYNKHRCGPALRWAGSEWVRVEILIQQKGALAL